MTYSSTIGFDPATGLLSGQISSGLTTPMPPLGDVVVSGFVDGSNLHQWFAQCRTRSSGDWVLSTSSLTAGSHVVSVSFDYGPVAASATIETAGPGTHPDAGGIRTGLTVNQSPRS